MNSKVYTTEIAGQTLSVTVGKFAQQTNGSALVSLGESTVLVTVVMSEKPVASNYLPLFVEYQEKFYANGKIKGSRFVKREGKPSDEAILTGRLVDRAIRPFFSDDFRHEVQVIITALSIDDQNDPDVIALFGASLVLMISDIPWHGPVAGLRVGFEGDNYILNPSFESRQLGQMDAIVAINQEERLVMMELGGKQVIEAEVVKAVQTVKSEIVKMIELQQSIYQEIGLVKQAKVSDTGYLQLREQILTELEGRLESALYGDSKATKFAYRQLQKDLRYKYPEYQDEVDLILDQQVNQLFKQNILEFEQRPDGRSLNQIRQLSAETDLLPRVHGSALFDRGDTQTLSVLTLGSPGEAQIIDEMKDEIKKRFMHHYNFPPYSVSEIAQIRGVGRREIGHGALVEKALEPVLPSTEQFPYTIRIVSEVLSSNGSSSQASICSSSLALMAAGVPITNPVAGIAIGIVEQDGRYKILTDIQGPEDHFGEMDFKVAGTKLGVTAIQLDIKGKGMTEEILADALNQARLARLQILEVLTKTIVKPRAEVSKYAPKIESFRISPHKIRDVIGAGGKVINEIIDQTGVKIDIEDSGQVFVTGEDMQQVLRSKEWILDLAYEPKVGEIFQGKVVKIMPFGAFVSLKVGLDGLIHISELSSGHINKVEDVLQLHQQIPVKIKKIDPSGKISLALDS